MKQFRNYLYALIAAAAMTALLGAGTLQRVDKWLQDWLFQHPRVTAGDIVIIGIDETALDLLGPYYTWDRTVVASALEALAADPEKKPAVTAIDILYAGTTAEEADAQLAKAAEDLGNVVTACMAEYGTQITWEDGHAVSMDKSAVLAFEEPYEALREVTVQGHINAMEDRDGILRHALLYEDLPDGSRVYSMAYETARLYAEQNGQTLDMPMVNRAGHFYVPFTAKPGGYYDGVSIAALISGKVPADYWAGKIVLIGPYATALQDSYYTSIAKAKAMYGVEFQANVIQSLLEGRSKVEVPEWIQLAVLFFLCFAAGIWFQRLKPAKGAILFGAMVIAGFGLSYLLYQFGFLTHPLWIPVCAAVLYVLSLLLHYVQAAREKQALALEKERIDAELKLATRIQTEALLKEFPPFPDRTEFDLYASMDPAKEVGGDLYDFFLIDPDHLALVIGDVSGKGIPAALFMMLSITLIRHIARTHTSPSKILMAVNEEICARNPAQMFVSVWLGILEISTGKMITANAGHEYPALKKPDGSFELLLGKHGLVVGAMEGIRYRETELMLEPGAKLFVYTDGAPEATDSHEELFGNDRLIEALRDGEQGTPKEILETVDRHIREFVGEAPQFDDLTMLCLEYRGPGA